MSIFHRKTFWLPLILAVLFCPIFAAQETTPHHFESRIKPSQTALSNAALQASALDRQLWRHVIESQTDDMPLLVAVYCDDPAPVKSLMKKCVIRKFKPLGLNVVIGIPIDEPSLIKAASIPGVHWVTSAFGAPMNQPDVMFPDDPPPAAKPVNLSALRPFDSDEIQMSAEKWPSSIRRHDFFDVGPGHGAAADTNGDGLAPWDKSIRGQGVWVAVVDDGIDFGHPDLQGTWAIYPDTFPSPYAGHPYAFSPTSLLLYVSDLNLGTNFVKWAFITWYCDTSETPVPIDKGTHVELQYAPFVGSGSAARRGPFFYRAPKTSLSGGYRMGTHPDSNLFSVYRHKVAVLLVDENEPGVYDTVYTDIDNNLDFRNDKPCRYGDPLAALDRNGDGVADLSAGIVTFIADGQTPLPMSWLYGDELLPTPANGALVVFDGPFDNGYSHGTQIASVIAGQGKTTTGGPVFADVPDGKPGAAIQGLAPDARLISVSNVYRSGAAFFDAYIFCAYGFDGIANSGDEPQIANLSFGYPDTVNAGLDFQSRFIQAIETQLAPHLSFVHSTGNAGPGFSTTRGPIPLNGLNVAASTTYGSTGWDSLRDAAQIEFGDIANFSSRGPDALGRASVDIAADGAYAAGAQSLNYYLPQVGFTFDGRLSWNTWGGTSRSAPVAAGGLALVYQAWKNRTGQFPDASDAASMLMAGARFAHQEPFTQGAGVMDCDNAVDLAGGEWGISVMPARLTPGAALDTLPGDPLSMRYPAFPSAVFPGQESAQTFTLNNHGDLPTEVELSAFRVEEISHFDFEIQINRAEESAFHFMIPDYLHQIPAEQIPDNADLMVVRLLTDFAEFDYNESYFADERWYMTLLNWSDHNSDGMLWNDANGNNVVNHKATSGFHNIDRFPAIDWLNTEMQQGEFARLDYSKLSSTTHEIAFRRPRERMKDGLFVGLHHHTSFGPRSQYLLKARIEFYRMAEWPWILFTNGSAIQIDGHSAAEFDASFQVPLTASPGNYGGFIRTAIPGMKGRKPQELHIPVNFNVAARLHENIAVEAGSAAESNHPAPGLFRNDLVRGLFNWEWRRDSGDQRTFWLDLDTQPTSGTITAIRTVWHDEATTMTDIDMQWLSPLHDFFSGDELALSPDNSSLISDPATFGPYSLELMTRSEYTNQGAGIWKYSTSSGLREDWIQLSPSKGIHQLRLQNVLHSGKQFSIPFSTSIINFRLDPSANPRTVITPAGTLPMTLISSCELDNFRAVAYGPGVVKEFTEYVSDDQDNSNSTDVFDPSQGWWVTDFTMTRPFRLKADLRLDDSAPADGEFDLDLLIYFDENNDGVTTHTKELIAVSLSGDSNESIELSGDLEDGLYRVAVYGFHGDAPFRLMLELIEGQGYSVAGLGDAPLRTDEPAEFVINFANVDPAPEQNPGVIVLTDENNKSMVIMDINLIRPSLAIELSAAPDELSPGDAIVATVTGINGSDHPVEASISLSWPHEMKILSHHSGHASLAGGLAFVDVIPARSRVMNEFNFEIGHSVSPGTTLTLFVEAKTDNGLAVKDQKVIQVSQLRNSFESPQCWTFNVLPGVFTEAEGRADDGRLIIDYNDNFSFGAWSSPPGEIHLTKSNIYHVSVRAGADAGQLLAPDIRFRFNDDDLLQSDLMLITASAGGAAAPAENGRLYEFYLDSHFINRPGAFSFDVLNIDPSRASQGEVFMDEYTISVIADEFKTWRLEKVFEFSDSAEGWRYSGAVPPFDPAIAAHAEEALLLRAASNVNCFGSWFVEVPEIPFEAGRLYLARFFLTISEADFTRMPMFRFRFGAANFAQTHVQNHQPAEGDSSARWSDQLINGFSIYFEPAPELFGVPGAHPLLAVDLLGLDPSKSPSAALMIDRVEIRSRPID